MLTRKTILILSSAAVLAGLVATRFGTRFPFAGAPERLPEIKIPAKPSSRPERPDLALFGQFQGQPMAAILQAFLAKGEPAAPDAASAASILAGSLPKAPFPFPKDAKPVNELSLKQYLENVDSGKLGDLSPADLWRYNVVSAALGRPADALPAALKMNILPANETENFPVHFAPREISPSLKGPVVAGNFDAHPGLELISHGGTRLWSLDEKGNPKEPPKAIAEGPGIVRPADFDQDGHLDLYLARRRGLPNSLLRNDGSGNFTDITSEAGLLAFGDTTDAVWTDFDNDGLLDLVVANEDHPLEIYRQETTGVFKPVAWDLDLWIPGKVARIVAADFNQDGYPDLYVSRRDAPDQLLYSIPSTLITSWRFLDKSASVLRGASNQVAVAMDFDNDGDWDLLIGQPSGDGDVPPAKETGRLKLFQNNGEGAFSDVTAQSGLDKVTDVRKIHVLDMDRDGFDDLIVITRDLAFNQAFWNLGGTCFRDVSSASRLSYLDSPADIFSVDLDGSGATELFMTGRDGSVTWLKSGPESNGWLGIRLKNALPGTKITVLSRDSDWILQSVPRTLNSGVPFLTVGLGATRRVEKVEIFSPKSKEPVTTLEKIKPNQVLDIDLLKLN